MKKKLIFMVIVTLLFNRIEILSVISTEEALNLS